ncbi:MAG: T9SS type A sorting domain-containing protein [Phycisphaerales bacterium]|nr:T9SS type A sorting domain-containing protein [Phycisphaerales bacterium]
MFKDYNLNTNTFTKSYSLTGSSAAPNVDSFTDFKGATPVMSSYPANGTVYRFIPVATSIGETTIAEQFNVYPTVTNQSIHVDYTQSTRTIVDIYTTSGQLAKSISIEKGENTIDISALANGNYLLNVSNAEGKASFKFIKY